MAVAAPMLIVVAAVIIYALLGRWAPPRHVSGVPVKSNEFGNGVVDRSSSDCCGHDTNGLSRMSVGLDFDHGAEPWRQHVLAVWRMRRDLERRSTGVRREPSPYVVVSAHVLTRELEELIAALDRRVPRIEQAGETTIARDAAALRAKPAWRHSSMNPSSRRRGQQAVNEAADGMVVFNPWRQWLGSTSPYTLDRSSTATGQQ
jgi:hypothetical protein